MKAKEKPRTVSPEWLTVIILTVLSMAANIYFYFTLSRFSVGFGDAWSRINISRRVVDSLTPGFAQLGGIWLPFPQLPLVPFAAIDALYFSGIAGAFISSPAYILGGLYLYKSLIRLTSSRLVSLVGMLLYATNINLLYLQTTAMSEPLFLAAVCGTLYHFTVWAGNIKQKSGSLILSALWAFVASLTRYEGFFLVMVTAICVFITAYIGSKKIRIAEGFTTFFMSLSGLGIFLWCVYSWSIFGHPLNWLRIYTGQIPVISTESIKPTETWGITTYQGNVQKSVISVIEAALEMNGILFSVPVILGLSILSVRLVKKRDLPDSVRMLMPLLIASVPALFLMVSSFRGTALVRNPSITPDMLWDPKFHMSDEYNLRYGLLALPFFVVLSSLAFSKGRILKAAFTGFAVIHIILMFIRIPVTVFSFPHRYAEIASTSNTEFQDWFADYYDGGLILVSAIANDQLMYSLKIPYRNYIYEGTGKYWIEAIDNPVSLARYVMIQAGPKVTNTGGSSDFVSYHLQDTAMLNDNYDPVYRDSKIVVYRLKNPDGTR